MDRANVRVVAALGERRYWGMLRAADVMVGNSSSGLIEAPAAHLPVVNVGRRQRGRMRHPMTLDVEPVAEKIRDAIRTACGATFRDELRGAEPLYPVGPAWPIVLEILAGWVPPRPPVKRFEDWPEPPAPGAGS